MKTRRGFAWVIALGIGLASVSSAHTQTQTPKPPEPKVFQIEMSGVAFADAPTGIRVGDSVEWINKDIVDHTATSRVGGWDLTVPIGKKARVAMKKAGTLEYTCRFHPNMTSKISVGPPRK